MAPQNTDLEVHQENWDADPATSRSISFGEVLANPPPGEEVCITGLAGKYPDSDNVYEFRDGILNKKDLVSSDNRRWEDIHPEIPHRTGKVPDVEKFDAGFFGLHYNQAHQMDPMMRLYLERAVEAVMDAGINPAELEGSKTGVYVGACHSESEDKWFYHAFEPQSFAATGCLRSMIAQRVSYFLKLRGPAYIADTACSSSLTALEHAYRAIRTGECDQAIVGGTILCLHPMVSLQFARLGVLSPDGACKCFDEKANGYARSETVSAIFLQKSKDAKRVYAQVMHAKISCDGYKEKGVTYPSGSDQQLLLKEIYTECNIDPKSVTFVEAHGTGTKVGDPEEVSAIDEIFCKGRSEPLLMGSIKCNVGHTEPASGVCSVTKIIIGMECGQIPPNIYYNKPKPEITALVEGRVKVVTEPTPWPNNCALVGINNFGFGGANCHVLLRWNLREKLNGGEPRDNLPRLVCVSGRVFNAVDVLLDAIKERKLDAEYVNLLHCIFRRDVESHIFRGYSIVSKSGELKRSSRFFSGSRRRMRVVFGGVTKGWSHLAKDLLTLPLCATTFQRVNDVLSTKSIDMTDILTTAPTSTILTDLLASVAIQVVVVDLLKELNLLPEEVVGFSVGTFTKAYADGILKFEQAILGVYYLGYLLTKFCKKDQFALDDQVQFTKAVSSISAQLLLHLSHLIPPSEQKETSAEYFLHCLLNHNEQSEVVTTHAVVLGVGHEAADVTIAPQKGTNGVVILLDAIGSLYEYGYNPEIEKLYPKVEYPVSRGTPMISPFIKWNQTNNWTVIKYESEQMLKSAERHIKIEMKENQYDFVVGHVVDGRNLFPATGYIHIVWKSIAFILGLFTEEMKIVFEDVKFKRATTISKDKVLGTEMIVMIQRLTGNFEIVESGAAIVTGKVSVYDFESDLPKLPIPQEAYGTEYPHLKEKDIYKELKLRGYNYTGLFRGLKECDNSATRGEVFWDGNWITFMDNMLQMQILQADTRSLYVPTTIKKLYIDAKKHVEYANQFENSQLPVYVHRDARTIVSGGIQISHLNASAIARRKITGIPVLEKNVFAPNEGSFSVEESVRINMQIALENHPSIKVKVIEVVDEAASEDYDPIVPIVLDVLGDLPLIQPEIFVLTKRPLEIPNVSVENTPLASDSGAYMVVLSNALSRPQALEDGFKALKENGFILSREPLDFKSSDRTDVNVFTVYSTKAEKLVLFRKQTEAKKPTEIKITNDDYAQWLPHLQTVVKSNKHSIIYSQRESNSGILGLFNCMRREPGGDNISCFFVVDEDAPEFDLDNEFYRKQQLKNMAVNVYKNGSWGTYRHLLLDTELSVECEHSYVTNLVRGDLSSLTWIEGPLKTGCELTEDTSPTHVYYAALNFRDVMLASGRISIETVSKNRLEQECNIGFEFSGKDQWGRRIMGLHANKVLGTMIVVEPTLNWIVPDDWTLEEAATIPAVYCTVLYAIKVKTSIKSGDSILIHAGTGGVGQAAITLCLQYGCTVFTTVGTPEKREYIKERFPQIQDSHIGNSRDTSFLQMIQKETKGRGVDFVLNSLAEEKLVASVSCLAKGGHFLEIGKFDLANDSPLRLALLAKSCSFHGIMLDGIMDVDPAHKLVTKRVFNEALKLNIIKPLPRKVFERSEVEQAFRFMGAGKHMGKILIKVREEEEDIHVPPVPILLRAQPRYLCDPTMSYVIVGGLGGFGLELADWLLLRGATKLVLTSRTGIQNGYQGLRLRLWKSYGAEVMISTEDISTKEGCVNLLESANELGPVHAIFNLAVVLKDNILENQTVENYDQSFKPKAIATEHLDELSRTLCPHLRDFVVFSSVSCGRGNAGQTNYGMANSIMERICEQRKQDGFPALAIQWGAIGEVGLVADMQEAHTELEIGGTLQQRLSSCLSVMDVFLRQSEPIVSSMVVADKRSYGGSDNVVDCVAHIMGIRDLKTVSLSSSLAELGMDSMMAVEIKQTLERDFEVFLTPQELRSLTFGRLVEIRLEQESSKDRDEDLPEDTLLLIRHMGDENMATKAVVRLPSLLSEGEAGPTIFLLPGLEGMSSMMEPLAVNLMAHVLCLQFCYDQVEKPIPEMAKAIFTEMRPNLSTSTQFRLLAYSYGTCIALELLALLEQNGYNGEVVMLDGSPIVMKKMVYERMHTEDEAIFQTDILCAVMSLYTPTEIVIKCREAILKCETYPQRVQVLIDSKPENIPVPVSFSVEYQQRMAFGVYNRLSNLTMYEPTCDKITTKVTLVKPSHASVKEVDEDYGWSKWLTNPCDVKCFKGNHTTLPKSRELADFLNGWLKCGDELERSDPE